MSRSSPGNYSLKWRMLQSISNQLLKNLLAAAKCSANSHSSDFQFDSIVNFYTSSIHCWNNNSESLSQQTISHKRHSLFFIRRVSSSLLFISLLLSRLFFGVSIDNTVFLCVATNNTLTESIFSMIHIKVFVVWISSDDVQYFMEIKGLKLFWRKNESLRSEVQETEEWRNEQQGRHWRQNTIENNFR